MPKRTINRADHYLKYPK